MLKLRIFLFSAVMTLGFSSQADEYRRVINVEWEPVEAAKTYDLELTPVPAIEGQEPIQAKTAEAAWVGKLTPGTYQMRIRARDRRGAPGAWSPAEEFKVGLDTPQLTSPKPKALISSAEDTANVEFVWKPVGGAKDYLLEIVSEDTGTKVTQVVTENKFTATLPAAKKYSWKVLARSEVVQSDAASLDDFTIMGQKIETPEIETPESQFVRQLKWKFPTHADRFDYLVTRQNPKTKKWEPVERMKDVQVTEIPFRETWPGGTYRFVVRAKGQLRANSNPGEIKFTVFTGDRSPAAQETFTLRQAIDRTTGYFGIASYLITSMQYSGNNKDLGTASVRFDSMGGTGRVGLGYLDQVSPWGFLGIVDVSGFFVDQKNYNFATAEVNALYRKNSGERGESRHQIGVSYKELPELVGNGFGEFVETTKISYIGPHYGYEYWYALTEKLGLQFNFHTYLSLYKVSTRNGGAIQPTPSFQTGLLGSYRLTQKMTGLAGYAYRNDSARYKASSEGQTNSVEIQGHYVNFFLEWAL